MISSTVEKESIAETLRLFETIFQYSCDALGPLSHLDHLGCLLLP